MVLFDAQKMGKGQEYKPMSGLRSLVGDQLVWEVNNSVYNGAAIDRSWF